MKITKLNLKNLEVSSFVTSLNLNAQQTIEGGQPRSSTSGECTITPNLRSSTSGQCTVTPKNNNLRSSTSGQCTVTPIEYNEEFG